MKYIVKVCSVSNRYSRMAVDFLGVVNIQRQSIGYFRPERTDYSLCLIIYSINVMKKLDQCKCD